MSRRGVIIAIVVIVIAVGLALALLAQGRLSSAPPLIHSPGGGTSQTNEPVQPGHDDSSGVIAVPEGTADATVEFVHDGDTLFLTDGTKVRLLGIDTPEVGDNLECYGDEATALLRALLPEGTHVHILADTQPFDQYGRSLLLMWLTAPDGEATTFVNLALIQQGAAEAVVLEPNVLYAQDFEAAEDAAQAADLGLWGACG